MPYARIYSDDEGASHFEDVDPAFVPVEFAPPAPPLNVADPIPAHRVLFAEVPSGWTGDWHPAPARQFAFIMTGTVEVSVSDGEKRRFAAGSVVLLEDVSGQGHRTRVAGEEDVRMVFVQLA